MKKGDKKQVSILACPENVIQAQSKEAHYGHIHGYIFMATHLETH